MWTLRLSMILSCALAIACHRSPKALVPDAMRAQLDAEEKARIDANRARSCKRPVLRGAAIAGAADDEILAIDAPSPEQPLYACITALKAWRDTRPAPYAVPPVETLSACATLPEAIAHAVAHEDVCSPYAEGRHAYANEGVPLLEASALVAIADAQTDRLAAAHMMLDFYRLQADVRRGEGSDVLRAMMGVAAVQKLHRGGSRPLFTTKGMRTAELDELAHELTTLEQSEPPFTDVLYIRGASADAIALPDGFDPRDPRYVYALVEKSVRQRVREACPATVNAATCVSAIRTAANTAQAATKLEPTTLDEIVAGYVPNAVRSWEKHAGDFALSRLDLRFAQLQLWINQHHCPVVESIVADAGELAIDPANGKRFDFRGSPAMFVVHPSQALGGDDFAAYRERTYPIACEAHE